MTGHYSKRSGNAAMGNRNTRISRNRNSRSNARHDFKRNASSAQGQRFFAAAAENKGVAPFKADYHLAFLRLVH